MRVAILADIHGNLEAFEAALEHVSNQHVDHVVLGGDIVNGAPDSDSCWHLARSLGYPILRGNHERYVAHFDTDKAEATWSTEQFAPLQWTVAQFSDEERESMGKLPLTLQLEGAPDLLIVHASARGDYDTVTSFTPEAELEQMFAGVRERYIVRGHNHVGRVRLWDDRFIITNGSAGWSLDGFRTAQYLIMEWRRDSWHVTQHAVRYDVDVTLRRFEQEGYLEATGPMGVLFMREVATAAQHVVPFLRAYHQWCAQEPITLKSALERFLAKGY